MKKRIIMAGSILVLAIAIFFTGKSIRDEHYPIPISPSDTWQPFIENLDATHETLFIESDSLLLEADLFIPAGGSEQKPAIVFTPGSGDSLYQNYAEGFVEHYLLDLFLERDMVVLLINKRGMGQSEGNYVANTFQGRADDVYAGVQMLQGHQSVDASQVGVVGHSQGGWPVFIVASQHPDVAFYISLAGPTMTMYENSRDNSRHAGLCKGLEDQDLENFINRHMQGLDLAYTIGELTGFGYFGFDARSGGYDPADDLRTITQPGLFIYAEHDNLVTPSLNLALLDTIFEGNVPGRISTHTLRGVNHIYQVVSDPCQPFNPNLSPEYFEVMNAWLDSQGY